MKKSILLAISCAASIVACAKEPPAGWQPHKQLVFVENKGQITDQYGQQRTDIQFKLESQDINMFIGSGQLHYQWYKADPIINGQLSKRNVSSYRMDVTLVGANPNAQAVSEDKQDYYERRYSASKDKEITAGSYKKITYQNVYPNIDWVFYVSTVAGKENQVEYDFVVHPGGKVSDIQLQYGGASSLDINNGSLTATTPFGTITEQTPYSYAAANTIQTAVSSHFNLKGNTLSFSAASYTGTLVIDPSLLWATYYGGTGLDLGNSIATDKNGNVYFYGQSIFSADIATTGSYQENNAGDFDAFIAKFTSSGNRIWATYYGGSGDDNGFSIACDGNNGEYISGFTNSPDGIYHNGFQPIGGNANSDLFLAKFDTSGNLVWGTYYGGPSDETGGFCAVDGMGHVYLTGYTTSTTGIATSNSYQATNGGGTDAFLVQFDTAGTRNWATFFGSDSADYGEGVACDAAGNVYMGGRTSSLTHIATTGSYQTVKAAGVDEYLAKFNSTGSLLWATYFGGDSDDNNGGSNVLACDAFGDIYLNGMTNSTNGIATTGATQTTFGGGTDDAFLVKFDGNGNRKWATYYGGSDIDYGQTATCDPQGNVFLCGSTKSTNNMATTGAYQDNNAGAYDAYLVEFDSAGNRQWGTYFGGSATDNAYGVTLDDSGRVYIIGSTGSSSNIATPGSFLTTFNGFNPVYVAKFCYAVTTLPAIAGNDTICANSTHTYSVAPIPGATAYIWTKPASWTGSSDSSSIQVTADATSGALTLKVVKCNDTSNVQTISVYASTIAPVVISASGLVLSTANSYSTYQWYLNGQPLPNATNATYTAAQNGVYTVKVANAAGCMDSSAVGDTVTGVSVKSIEQIAKAIVIYPNPANSIVHIISPVAVNVAISSMDGKLVSQQQQAKDVNVAALATGIYMLRITDGNGTLIKTEKLTKVNQ